MKKILLICAGGMSTSLLVSKMRVAAREMGIEVYIEAVGTYHAEEVVEGYDIILLGPQIRFQKDSIEKMVNGKVPIEVINMKLYGTMNGKAVLEDALTTISLKEIK